MHRRQFRQGAMLRVHRCASVLLQEEHVAHGLADAGENSLNVTFERSVGVAFEMLGGAGVPFWRFPLCVLVDGLVHATQMRRALFLSADCRGEVLVAVAGDRRTSKRPLVRRLRLARSRQAVSYVTYVVRVRVRQRHPRRTRCYGQAARTGRGCLGGRRASLSTRVFLCICCCLCCHLDDRCYGQAVRAGRGGLGGRRTQSRILRNLDAFCQLLRRCPGRPVVEDFLDVLIGTLHGRRLFKPGHLRGRSRRHRMRQRLLPLHRGYVLRVLFGGQTLHGGCRDRRLPGTPVRGLLRCLWHAALRYHPRSVQCLHQLRRRQRRGRPSLRLVLRQESCSHPHKVCVLELRAAERVLRFEVLHQALLFCCRGCDMLRDGRCAWRRRRRGRCRRDRRDRCIRFCRHGRLPARQDRPRLLVRRSIRLLDCVGQLFVGLLPRRAQCGHPLRDTPFDALRQHLVCLLHVSMCNHGFSLWCARRNRSRYSGLRWTTSRRHPRSTRGRYTLRCSCYGRRHSGRALPGLRLLGHIGPCLAVLLQRFLHLCVHRRVGGV